MKSKSIFFILLNCVLLINKFASGNEAPLIKCDPRPGRFHGEIRCHFTDIHLNSTNYDWQPTVPTYSDPKNVLEANFEKCTISVVTNNLCPAFVHLEIIELHSSGVKEVKEDAFKGCDQLKRLYLQDNQIEELPEHVFAPLKILIKLRLQGNKLKELNLNLFSELRNLDELSLGKNLLKNFPPQLLRNSQELNVLLLYSNDLTDLDVEHIFPYVRSLYAFDIDDNDISCKRMENILNYLQLKNIRSSATRFSNKVRDYQPKIILENFKCRPDERTEKEIVSKIEERVSKIKEWFTDTKEVTLDGNLML